MINFAFRLLLTFNATSLLLIIFLVQKCEVLGTLIPVLAQFNIPSLISYAAYLVVPIALTGISIFLS
jgi:cell shape-determining protein MreD